MELTEQSIRNAYAKFSSPSSVEDNEIEFLLKKKCECDQCGDNVLKMYDFPVIDIEHDELLCENCEIELKYTTCAVCEDHFMKPIEPNDHRFFIGENVAKELNMPMGIYQVKQFPFYYGCLIGGFESFFDDAIELVSTTDIQKIKMFKCGKTAQDVTTDYICPECFDKYTGKQRINYNYTNKDYSMHLSISVRGMINI